MTARTFPGGLSFGYSFDADGPMKTQTDASGTTTYTIDSRARVSREDFPGATYDAYSYDAASNLTMLGDAGGTTSYTYDGLNRMTSLKEPGDTQSTTLAYNADGQRTQMSYPSGVSVNWTYLASSGRVDTVTNKAPSGSVLKRFSSIWAT